jgi:hypothetical protein
MIGNLDVAISKECCHHHYNTDIQFTISAGIKRYKRPYIFMGEN